MTVLTNPEAAALIGIKPNTLEIWRVKGKGPKFFKLGPDKRASVRYERSEVERWKAEHTFASTSAYAVAGAR